MLALLLAGCRGSDGVTVLKVAHNGPAGHPFQAGFEEFSRVLEERSDGAVTVQIFENEQLGTEEEATLMVKLGALAASAASAGGGIAAFVPEAEIFNFPFIFRDLDHFYRVVDGPIGERVAARIEEELDVLVLGYWFAGRRNAWNAERPIVVPDDFEGLKIRVIPTPILVDTFNALGAQRRRCRSASSTRRWNRASWTARRRTTSISTGSVSTRSRSTCPTRGTSTSPWR